MSFEDVRPRLYFHEHLSIGHTLPVVLDVQAQAEPDRVGRGELDAGGFEVGSRFIDALGNSSTAFQGDLHTTGCRGKR